jgi:hypothetical protein
MRWDEYMICICFFIVMCIMDDDDDDDDVVVIVVYVPPPPSSIPCSSIAMCKHVMCRNKLGQYHAVADLLYASFQMPGFGRKV